MKGPMSYADVIGYRKIVATIIELNSRWLLQYYMSLHIIVNIYAINGESYDD